MLVLPIRSTIVSKVRRRERYEVAKKVGSSRAKRELPSLLQLGNENSAPSDGGDYFSLANLRSLFGHSLDRSWCAKSCRELFGGSANQLRDCGETGAIPDHAVVESITQSIAAPKAESFWRRERDSNPKSGETHGPARLAKVVVMDRATTVRLSA